MSYFNTTGLGGQQLDIEVANANNQDELIMHNLKYMPRVEYTPFEISRMLHDRFPITSIRRSIHTLTSKGKLIKTNIMRKGDYGKPNHTWKINHI